MTKYTFKAETEDNETFEIQFKENDLTRSIEMFVRFLRCMTFSDEQILNALNDVSYALTNKNQE